MPVNIGLRPEGASAITVRVSRDGGRTYDRPSAVAIPHQERRDPLAELRDSLTVWPPCQCPRHRAGS